MIELDPHEWVKSEIEDKFTSGELQVNDLKNIIQQNYEKVAKIREQIPEQITVSIFKVDCSTIRNYFSQK